MADFAAAAPANAPCDGSLSDSTVAAWSLEPLGGQGGAVQSGGPGSLLQPSQGETWRRWFRASCSMRASVGRPVSRSSSLRTRGATGAGAVVGEAAGGGFVGAARDRDVGGAV